MSMVRINADIRDQIVRNLLKKKYLTEDLEVDSMREKYEALTAEMNKLAYEACFPAPTRKMLTSSAEGFFPVASHVKVRIEKGDESNYYDTHADFGENLPIPFRNSPYGGSSFAAVLKQDHPYVTAVDAAKKVYAEIETTSHELRDKKRADERRILTVIESVTTIKRLQEIWPQVIDYLPEEVSGKDGQLPVEMIAELNKSFGL